MSGRSLRRLPVLAHARYIGTLPMFSASKRATHVNGTDKMKKILTEGAGTVTEVEVWLNAMGRVVEAQATERSRLER